MTERQPSAGPGHSSRAPRVGFFGHLGAGNIGNDASMECVFRYLRAERPDAIVDAMCPGPECVKERYAIEAIYLFWHHKYDQRVSGALAIGVKILGKALDVVRTARWVRRHDVVIVPGAGVLESSLPLRPWGMPYAMFLLSLSGRLFGTKIALVSVGAGAVNQRMTRWLFNSSARLAFYRSYRDASALEAMRQRGLDTRRDHVYYDLAFALPQPPAEGGGGEHTRIVAVGVMAYFGSNDDRKHAGEIYSSYVTGMKHFVRYLVSSGRQVRLLVGDTNGSDGSVVEEILTDLRESRPHLHPSSVTALPVTSFTDVMRAMLPADSVVAIRYHNVVAALRISKPTISIGYSPKHDILMKDMGLADFCQSANTIDVARLIDQLTELEKRSVEIREMLQKRNDDIAGIVDGQFSELSSLLFSVGERNRTATVVASSGQVPVEAAGKISPEEAD